MPYTEQIMVAEGNEESPGTDNVKLEDVSKSEGGTNLDSLSDSSNDIDDSDLIVSKEDDTNWVKKTASKVWDYIKSKLDIGTTADGTYLNKAGQWSTPPDTNTWPDANTYKTQFLNYAYPVGSIYVSTKNVSPATFLGGTWISLSGYMLRGATSGVTANSNAKDGGSDNLIIPYHNHTFTGSAVTSGASSASNTGTQSANHKHTVNGGATNTGGMSANNPHSHATQKYDGTWITNIVTNTGSGSRTGNYVEVGWGSNQGHAFGSNDTNIAHTHSQVAHTHSVGDNLSNHTHDMKHTHSVTAAGTVGYAGTSGNTTNANLPNYKNVYMWERTA